MDETSGSTAGDGADTGAQERPGAGTGRRRRASAGTASPQVRGGHPQQPEWDTPGPERYGPWQGGQRSPRASGPQVSGPQVAGPQVPGPQVPGPQVPGPRKEFVDAFTDLPGGNRGTAVSSGTLSVPDTEETPALPGSKRGGTGGMGGSAASGAAGTSDAPKGPSGSDGPGGSDTPGGTGTPGGAGRTDGSGDAEAGSGKNGKGRTFAGIAAAAVTTVLAVVVAGQVAGGGDSRGDASAAGRTARATGEGAASRGDTRVTPKAAPLPLTYTQKMSKLYPLAPKLKASGDFSVVPGSAKAPGHGRKYRYRVDIEKGMGLDGTLFADAVQKTLNDKRSWAHNGVKTFERVSSGHPDFVITLASPVTTADWCAKSGLDTLEENVSCDSAATDRVMINAYRWAQGSPTYGDSKIYPYRQMLINHEVGHRLGHNHVSCRTPGALAPVMQQQTKSLDIDGIKCRANPWVYPTG
ncbi:DUF3152 domain-containing protein [Streptomyces sp. NPDC059398]|uniref:DUF3152 domain-containing protein n=1 Tax=Streptomyces sp. NPDC059398 TaxID=3346820 RepID=UPI0036B3B8FA